MPLSPPRCLSLLCVLLIVVLSILSYSCKKTGSSSNGNTGGGNGQPSITAVGTPIGNPVTINIGAAGGSITSEDGRVQLTIPAGALTANTAITIQAVTNHCPGGIGVAYDFQPNGTKFATPALLRFNYADSDANGTSPYLFYAAFQDNTGGWQLIDSDKDIDTVGKTASFDISHFTGMAMTAEIQITASKTEYKEGESGTLSIIEWTPIDATNEESISVGSAVPSNKLSLPGQHRGWQLIDSDKDIDTVLAKRRVLISATSPGWR